MGSELRRMIRDGAPATWTGPMIHVAKEIADDARDPSQGVIGGGGAPWSAIPIEGHFDRSGRWRDGLTERTGMSARAISRALADLAEAGYEMREAIGTDKRGRPVYAAKGHAVRFRVPPLSPRPVPERVPAPAAVDADSSPGTATFDADGGPEPVDNSPDRSPSTASIEPQSPPSTASIDRQRSPSTASKVAKYGDPIPPLTPTTSSHTPVNGSVEGARHRRAPVENRNEDWPAYRQPRHALGADPSARPENRSVAEAVAAAMPGGHR